MPQDLMQAASAEPMPETPDEAAMKQTYVSSPSNEITQGKSFAARLLAGQYGLAITYWAFYFIGSGLFFVFGSRAVDGEQWPAYFIIVAVMLAYTTLLIIGVRAAYHGPQLWKVMSRTSSVFMIINILVGISTLGFVY